MKRTVALLLLLALLPFGGCLGGGALGKWGACPWTDTAMCWTWVWSEGTPCPIGSCSC